MNSPHEPQSTVRTLVALLATLAGAACHSSSSSSGEGAAPLNPAMAQRYIFSYFKGNGEDGLHLAYSEDGLAWRALNNDQPFFQPDRRQGEADARSVDRARPRRHVPHGLDGRLERAGLRLRRVARPHHVDARALRPRHVARADGDEHVGAGDLLRLAQGRYQIVWASTIPGRFPGDSTGGGGKYNHRLYYTTTKDFRTSRRRRSSSTTAASA